MDGLINLDKPASMSSARAVAAVKRLVREAVRRDAVIAPHDAYPSPQPSPTRGEGVRVKVGHAGTLDPFATGVLLILVGKGTKLCETIMGLSKTYVTTIKLGTTTETGDPTSEEISFQGARKVDLEQIQGAIAPLVGAIQQRPPEYSALKIKGRPAYQLARRGQEVKLEPRTVQVYGITIRDYAWPLLEFEIHCGRGTYVRAIARDLGESLGVGGYLTQLRRTRIGPFDIGQAVTLEQLSSDGIERHLLPAAIKNE